MVRNWITLIASLLAAACSASEPRPQGGWTPLIENSAQTQKQTQVEAAAAKTDADTEAKDGFADCLRKGSVIDALDCSTKN
jgi:hypothetical protein